MKHIDNRLSSRPIVESIAHCNEISKGASKKRKENRTSRRKDKQFAKQLVRTWNSGSGEEE